VRFQDLSGLKRPQGYERELAALPREILMAEYAMAKAFAINDLVQAVHKGSYEWYGYTVGNLEKPELIADIGLPPNDRNIPDYTSVTPERIAEFRESLPRESVINGWIHSHGGLDFQGFSGTDEKNQITVLDFVTALMKKRIGKREVVIRDLVLLVKGEYGEWELEGGSVSLITDAPVGEARILEAVFGGFCYSIVIGDSGWHRQEIHYRKRGILSGHTTTEQMDAPVVLVDTGRVLAQPDIDVLREEVREKILPTARSPRERYEKECT
jgi:hypothetical protein